jgi:glycosyltransferase involved in cell wall biosynthesis
MSAATRLPVTLVMIAHDEEARIGRCLASFADLASEIVVLVNDCTDRTVEIAESYGARVLESSWHGYRDQKNLALEHATQPWILALDCDEEVSPELRASVVAFFAEGDHARYAGARFPRCVWFLGRWIRHGDWYPDLSLRLFPSGVRWSGSPEHDKIEVAGRVKRLRGDLYHYSAPNLSAHVDKINVFADVFLARQLATGARWSPFRAIFRSSWRFLRAYVFKWGFLDGFPGYLIARASAFATLVRYARLYEHERLHEHERPREHECRPRLGEDDDDARGGGHDLQSPERPDGGAGGVPRAA